MFETFDLKEWAELVMIDDTMDPMTRVLLCEYAQLFDRMGRAVNKPKLLAKTTGMNVGDVRKKLTDASHKGWLETITIDGRKGYKAAMPV